MLICFFPVLLFGNMIKQETISSTQEKLIRETVFESINSFYNGSKLKHKKINPFPDKDLEESFYSLSLEDIPLKPNQKFKLYTQNCIGGIAKICNVMVNKNLELETQLPGLDLMRPLEKNFLKLDGYMCGEPVDYILISNDGKIRESTHIIPIPIESHGSAGQIVKLEVRSKNGSLFFLIGENFNPFEPIELTYYSEEEKRMENIEANKDGYFLRVIKHSFKEKEMGDASICVKSANSPPLILHYVYGK